MKNKNLTNYNFIYFKLRVSYWMDFFGLKDWECDFKFKDNSDYRAMVHFNYNTRRCTFTLCPTINEPEKINVNQYIDKCAFHEVCHLLLSEYESLINSRCVTDEQIKTSNEKLITLLENVLWKNVNPF